MYIKMITKDYKTTEDDKKFAKDVREALVGSAKEKASVLRHSDFDKTPGEDIVIHTMYCKDCPEDGVVACMTLDSSLVLEEDDYKGKDAKRFDRVEFISAAQSKFTDFGSYIAGLAQSAAINGWDIKNGEVLENVLRDSSWKIKNVLFVKPFLWPDLGHVYKVGEATVHVWQIIPIYDSEVGVVKKDPKKFIEKLRKSELSMFDLNRGSINVAD